jgi:hypothetical protein
MDHTVITINNNKSHQIDTNHEPNQDKKVSSIAQQALSCFAKIGQIGKSVYELSKRMNPFRALFNCPLTSFKTAFLLERGELPQLEVKSPYRPRPMLLKEVIDAKWADPLFSNFPPNREYIYIKKCSKTLLDTIMLKLGKGTHAIVAADRKGLPMGHMWNYVLESKENGETVFKVLDSYSKSYHEKGLKNPNKCFNQYNTADVEACIFFEKTPENIQLIQAIHR